MQFIDITLEITPEIAAKVQDSEKKALTGHLGTHFDVMDKVFPLEYTKRSGIVFDVRTVKDGTIDCLNIDLTKVRKGMFVAFDSGFIETAGYGTEEYRHSHPQLSFALIEALLEKNVSIIGIDFAGIRRGKEHTPADQLCADRGAFVVENLCCLDRLLDGKKSRLFLAHTYPMRYAGLSGLPCRVIAEI